MKVWDLKEFRLFIYALCITAMISGVWVVYIYSQIQSPFGTYPQIVVTLNQTKNDTAWEITVVYVSTYHPELAKTTNIEYRLLNLTGYPCEIGYLYEIDGVASSGYNVIWVDNDKSDSLSVNDTFIISKTGGSKGKAEIGYRFILLDLQYQSTVGDLWLV